MLARISTYDGPELGNILKLSKKTASKSRKYILKTFILGKLWKDKSLGGPLDLNFFFSTTKSVGLQKIRKGHNVQHSSP